MSRLDDWLTGSGEIPFEKAAEFLVDLQRPTVPGPPPVRTPQVQAGQLKIAAISMSRGVEALPEIERRALIDPSVAAALEFEQAKAENAELAEQLQASQAQLAMVAQQEQMAQQQLMQAQQAQEQMQAEIEMQAQEKAQAQEQAVNAQQASLSERVQSMEQREQLAQAATDMKGQLEMMAQGLADLRGQAAGPPPMEAAGPPLVEPDPLAPAKVRKEQEEAQKAQLEAEQQQAQAGLAEEQEAVGGEMQAAQQAAPAPAAPGGEEMASPGPGSPIAGAPQVPTPAGGALPKTSSEKLAAGSTTVQLPMSQYPKPRKQSVLAGASAVKLPAVGRVRPAIKRLTEESSKLESAVDAEQLEPEATPELGKKEDADLKEKQAAMWQPSSSTTWLRKVAMDGEMADASVDELADQLKGLSTDELSQLFRSLSENPSDGDVTVSRRREMTVPSGGPAKGSEEYAVGMGGQEIARRMQDIGLGKQAAPLSALQRAGYGAAKGAIIGAVGGGLSRGVTTYGKTQEMEAEARRANAIREAAKGAVMGAAVGAAAGGIGGVVSVKAQNRAAAGVGPVPQFHPQTGQAFSPEQLAAMGGQREMVMDRARAQALGAYSHLPGVIGGFIGGAKGPEAVEAMTAKQGSAELHPRLAKFASESGARERLSSVLGTSRVSKVLRRRTKGLAPLTAPVFSRLGRRGAK
jgi:hypothetical protein